MTGRVQAWIRIHCHTVPYTCMWPHPGAYAEEWARQELPRSVPVGNLRPSVCRLNSSWAMIGPPPASPKCTSESPIGFVAKRTCGGGAHRAVGAYSGRRSSEARLNSMLGYDSGLFHDVFVILSSDSRLPRLRPALIIEREGSHLSEGYKLTIRRSILVQVDNHIAGREVHVWHGNRPIAEVLHAVVPHIFDLMGVPA